MRKLLFPAVALIILITGLESQAWVFVPDKGDTGWQTYAYKAGPAGFSGTAGFVVSNVIDHSAYSELLLDNLSHGGDPANCDFEKENYSGFDLLADSYAEITTSASASGGKIYQPSRGDCFSRQCGVGPGISTAAFQNARHQEGTCGSILETAITLSPGERFTFDWAFLAGDQSPWNDFALFYLKDSHGKIVFLEGLAQIGSASAPASVRATILLLLE
jgi:hypothetical protein